MNGREMFTQMTNDKQTSKHKLGSRTDGRKCRQTIAVQIAKCSSNGNNAKDRVD